MKIICDFSLIEESTTATVGFFDGVHLGHRYLIKLLKEYAKKSKLKTAIITFPIHPCKILQKDYQPFLLNTFEEKVRRLSLTEIDYCYVINFTQEFSKITAQDFIQQILHKQLRIKELLVGYDNRFGKGRIYGYKQYVQYGKSCGMSVRQIDKLPEKEDIHNSSTSIRQLLMEGKVKKAADKLSYYYSLEGKVVQGNQLGRTIDYPTANISLYDKEKVIPCKGIYATYVFIKGDKHIGMTYIGKRPTITFDEDNRIEVNIFDFDKNIYGKRIRIEFLQFIRPDIYFHNLKELQKQLGKDKAKVKKLLPLPSKK